MSIESLKDKYKNLTRKECGALFHLKNEKTIVIKGVDKGLEVLVCDKNDYIQEAKNNWGIKL